MLDAGANFCECSQEFPCLPACPCPPACLLLRHVICLSGYLSVYFSACLTACLGPPACLRSLSAYLFLCFSACHPVYVFPQSGCIIAYGTTAMSQANITTCLGYFALALIIELIGKQKPHSAPGRRHAQKLKKLAQHVSPVTDQAGFGCHPLVLTLMFIHSFGEH